MLYLSFPERRGTAPPPRARSVFRCGLCAGFFLLCVERTALKKVTIEGTRGGSPRRPGRAGKPAGRWGSYASRAAPTVGVGGAHIFCRSRERFMRRAVRYMYELDESVGGEKRGAPHSPTRPAFLPTSQ